MDERELIPTDSRSTEPNAEDLTEDHKSRKIWRKADLVSRSPSYVGQEDTKTEQN
jgi:hypothetical protein